MAGAQRSGEPMSRYPRARSSPASGEMRELVHAEADRCMDALEFGLDVAVARERILDALSVYVCEVETRRAINEKKRGAA